MLELSKIKSTCRRFRLSSKLLLNEFFLLFSIFIGAYACFKK